MFNEDRSVYTNHYNLFQLSMLLKTKQEEITEIINKYNVSVLGFLRLNGEIALKEYELLEVCDTPENRIKLIDVRAKKEVFDASIMTFNQPVYDVSIVGFLAEKLLTPKEERTKKEQDREELISIKEIAERLDLNVKAVQMRLYRKGIEPIKVIGKSKMYNASIVNELEK